MKEITFPHHTAKKWQNWDSNFNLKLGCCPLIEFLSGHFAAASFHRPFTSPRGLPTVTDRLPNPALPLRESRSPLPPSMRTTLEGGLEWESTQLPPAAHKLLGLGKGTSGHMKP